MIHSVSLISPKATTSGSCLNRCLNAEDKSFSVFGLKEDWQIPLIKASTGSSIVTALS